MLIDPVKRFVFVAIPRTASSSMLHKLIGYSGSQPEPVFNHATISQILSWCPDARNYYKFCFIRNPWDRLLSMYHDMVEIRKSRYSSNILCAKHLLETYKDFNDFVAHFENSHWRYDVHFAPQVDFIYEHGLNIMNFVGRYEYYNDDCKRLEWILKTTFIETPVHRKTSHKPYQEVYNDNSRDVVSRLYSKDISEFGYAF